MRIAIINKTAGGMSGGYRKYLCNVIPRLASNLNVESILCASPKSLKILELLGELPNVKFVNCQPFRFLHHKVEPELENYLEKFSPDIIFIPLGRYIQFRKIPTVNMVRNMLPLVYFPKEYPLMEKLKFIAQRIEVRIAVKRVDRIIAVSNFVKDFLIKRWGIFEEKIGVVYHGNDCLDSNEQEQPSIPKNWKGKFIFTAGLIQPYRGLEDILLAIKYLVSQNIEIEGLVIAGRVNPNMFSYQNKLKKWIKTQNLSSKICWVGALTEKEMNWCYRNCKIFVITSRVEACPNIALEAMSHGCISISADNPPLPEIFGDTAIFYSPKRYECLIGAIQTVLRWDNYKLKEISERAKEQAAKFSWDITVEKLLVNFKKAIETVKMKE